MLRSIPSLPNCSLNFRTLTALLLCQAVSRARTSPDDFAVFCFTDPAGRPIRQARVHRDLQRFLSEQPHALVELPRDHGKSFQVCVRLLWELGRDPALRVKVVCASEALAAERGRFLRDAIAGNARLRLVFPELQPAQPWGATRFTVRRPAEVIGPSVTALGIGAASTGSRADLLVCDDVVDVKALHSRAERQRVKTFFHENLLNLLEPDGRCWSLFTPWHADDLSAALKHNPSFALFRRAVGEDLEPVWPERWPREMLAARRDAIGPAAFARAYRLLTMSEEDALIRPEWVQFWTEPAEHERTVLAVDPALSEKASADASALVMLALTKENQVHCLEAMAQRVAAPRLVELIDAADRRWQPDVILFESNAAFEGVRALLQRQAGFGPKVRGVTQTRSKESRVQAFSVSVCNGSFRLKGDGPLHCDPGQQALFDEMTTFPHGEHDDLLDAAAAGTAYLTDRRPLRVLTF
jgi:predicted phage terminase large subunit-like protein